MGLLGDILAIMGSSDGISIVSTIRRVGAHRCWGADGLAGTPGESWSWNPDAEVQLGYLRVRFMTEEEKLSGRPEAHNSEKNIYRTQLKREDFLNHGYTEGLSGCQPALAGTSRQGHSRTRMEEALESSAEGQRRVDRQMEKENEKLARKIEESEVRSARNGRRAGERGGIEERGVAQSNRFPSHVLRVSQPRSS